MSSMTPGRNSQSSNFFSVLARRTQKSVLRVPFRPKRSAEHKLTVSASLFDAARCGQLAIVRKLVESRRANVTDRDPDNATALHWAALNGHHDVCQYLVYRGAEVNALGGEILATPLHWAIQHSVLEVVQLLVYHRANPDIQDVQGFSGIHASVHASATSILNFLLQETVDVDASDHFGHTPLMWAAYRGDHQSVGLLLKHGAKVNMQDDHGLTPLHWAIANGNRLCIRILTSYGADCHARDKQGRTPQDMAQELMSLLTMKTMDGWKISDDNYSSDGSSVAGKEQQRTQPQRMSRMVSTSTIDVEDAPPSYDDPNVIPVPAYHLGLLATPSPSTTSDCTSPSDTETIGSGSSLPRGDGLPEPRMTQYPEKIDIFKLVMDAVCSAHAKERLYSLRGQFAEDALCLIQQILDDPSAFGLGHEWEHRFILRRLLTNFSQKADSIPPTLFLDGVDCEDKETLEIGGYADIFQARHDGKLVALKRLRISMVSRENQSYRKAFIREALTWRQLRHPFILPFSGVDSLTFKGYFCMANILVNFELHVQLADFGLALFADSSTASMGSHVGGSARWMCPNLLSGALARPNYTCDIYAFGCVCVEVFSRQPPYQGFNDIQVISQVLHHNARPERPSGDSGKELVARLPRN
ncbi:hypothetical protein NLI96_g2708 [Meripilus lineatus]|uniref:Protein kinase domain-containing protein n=1 Tax=Meripilus lineatus TaxID=2056292 RepID=A0AAD5VA97_9APHY|nr:hypothetical protein NLI96_g2708 [Physisporinus lineatus]